MSHSGGRSSIRGVSDLSAVSPLILELAGLKQNKVSPGETSARMAPGIINTGSIEMLTMWGV